MTCRSDPTESLSDPTRIETMIDQDPQQTAVLIRAVRPKEYAAHAPLRAFDKFLP